VVDFREIEFVVTPLAAETHLQEAAQNAHIQDLATFEAFVVAHSSAIYTIFLMYNLFGSGDKRREDARPFYIRGMASSYILPK
jgi:hypothetical protein